MNLAWVYLIRDEDTGWHKIGHTANHPEQRLCELVSQGTLQPKPNNYVLVGAWWTERSREQYLHNFFSPCRERGEWFSLEPGDVQEIQRLMRWNHSYASPECDHHKACEQWIMSQWEQDYRDYLQRIRFYRRRLDWLSEHLARLEGKVKNKTGVKTCQQQ
jgi:hypothetical protein